MGGRGSGLHTSQGMAAPAAPAAPVSTPPTGAGGFAHLTPAQVSALEGAAMAQIAADPALAAGIRDYTDPTTTANGKAVSQNANWALATGSHQIKGFLNQNARKVTNTQLRKMEQRFRKSHPQAAAYLSNHRKVGYGGSTEILRPIIAAANGYNVILAHNSTRSGSYIVTLNRAATTVCSQTNDNARPGMRNW